MSESTFRRRLWWIRGRTNVPAWVLIGCLLPLLVPPIALIVVTSFLDQPLGRGDGSSITLENWRLIGSLGFLRALRNTLVIAVSATLIAVMAGFSFAWLYAVTQSRWLRRALNAVTIPLVFAPLLTAIAWTALASPRSGLLNAVGALVNAPNLNVFSLGGMIWVTALFMIPSAYLTTRGALESMDASLIEASRACGAGALSTFRRVVGPLMAPAIGAAFLLLFAHGIGMFAIVTLLGPTARVETLQRAAYTAMSEAPTNPALAAMIGTLLASLAIVLMLYYRRLMKDPRKFRLVGQRGGRNLRSARVASSKSINRVIACVALAFLVIGVLLPYAALAYGAFTPFIMPEVDLSRLSLVNFERFFDNSLLTRGLRNTGILVGLGAGVIALVAWGVATQIRSGRGAASRYLELLAFVPLAMPPLAFALGALWATLAWPVSRDHLYGTVVLILLVHLIAYLPIGANIIGTGIVQLGPDLVDAARTSGAPARDRIRLITGPLLKPVILSAWLTLSLQVLTEAGMSVFVFTTSSVTTAVNVFLAAFDGNQPTMYAGAFILGTIGIFAISIASALLGEPRAPSSVQPKGSVKQ